MLTAEVVHPWFLMFLYTSAVCDFVLGSRMRADPERKGTYLVLSMCVNLGMLGYFKYVDFLIENIAAVLDVFGMNPGMTALGVFLPVGISFYTLQTMSYTIDIYRGSLDPRTNFLDCVDGPQPTQYSERVQ